MKSKDVAIGIGIAIFLPMLVHLGVEVICQAPQTAAAVAAARDAFPPGAVEPWDTARCDPERFAKVFFPVAYVIGVAAMILGIVLNIPGVGPGLLFGGLLTLMDGFSYWYWIDPRLRFLVLLSVFALILVLGIGDRASSAPAAPPPSSEPPQD